MLSLLYSLVTALIAPFALLILLFQERGRKFWWQRLGIWQLPPGRYLWLHGASRGEVQGLAPIVEVLERRGYRLLITSTSSSGLEVSLPVRAERRLLPFDSRLFLAFALRGVEVEGFIGSETELWPALLTRLRGSGVPCALINARLLPSKMVWYRRLASLYRRTLESFVCIAASDQRSRELLIELGAKASSIEVVGNTKYDRSSPSEHADLSRSLAASLFTTELPVIVLGSVHPGEEKILFEGLRLCLQRGLRFHLVVAPRHQERFEYFAAALTNAGFAYHRRSKGDNRSGFGVVLLDTFGELDQVYGIAELAFVGGSLVPIGGHNPLEPARVGCIPMMGPYDDVVSEITGELLAAFGMFRIKSAAEMAEAIRQVLSDSSVRLRYKENGRRIAELHRGAVARALQLLTRFKVIQERTHESV